MNNLLIQNTFRFVFFILLQVFIFNNINFGGYINPNPYILFILLYPIDANKNLFLLASFTLGLVMDMFMDTAGVHATACLVLAYFRPTILKYTFGLSYEYQTVKIADKINTERFMYLLVSIVLYNTVLFFLEIFNFNFLWTIIARIIFSTILTLLISIIIIYLIKPNK
jgi:rod shape-determining protein MreD